MSTQEFKSLARKHWSEWLPNRVRQLKREGKLDGALQGAAANAQSEYEDLMMNAGYRDHEAREVALKNHILLPPEPGAYETDEQREENAEAEREYQKNPPNFESTIDEE